MHKFEFFVTHDGPVIARCFICTMTLTLTLDQVEATKRNPGTCSGNDETKSEQTANQMKLDLE